MKNYENDDETMSQSEEKLCKSVIRGLVKRTHAANNKETSSIMHIDVSLEYFHAKAQRSVLIRLSVEDRIGPTLGKSGIHEEEHVRDEGRPAIGNVTGKSTSGTRDSNLDSARRICFVTRKIEYRI